MSDTLRLRIVFALLMSLLMSFLMTLWVTWLNLGLGPDFIARWRHAFLAAWPAAFLIVVLCGPTMQTLSARALRRLTPRRRAPDPGAVPR